MPWPAAPGQGTPGIAPCSLHATGAPVGPGAVVTSTTPGVGAAG